MLKKLIKFYKKNIRHCFQVIGNIIYSFALYLIYCIQFKNYLKKQNIPNKKNVDENLYLIKWRKLSKRIEPYSYRLFSRYCGNDPNIVPEDIGHSIIEAKLNPIRFRAFYSDKNLYFSYLNPDYLPATILYRMGGGGILTSAHKPLKENINDFLKKQKYSRLILKPSIDSSSGIGVMLFNRINDEWICGATVLTKDFLLNYGNYFVLQEAIIQHPYISQFCATSVNTLRIATYRSVTDESVNIVGSVLRIGKDGAFCDNAHAGGVFAGVDIGTGKLNNYVCDQYGNKSNVWNGIDFHKEEYIVPNWKKIVEFAKYLGSANHHCRLLALDIALDSFGNPKLIEWNCENFSFWVFMFSGKTPFGNFTDEIINFCTEET